MHRTNRFSGFWLQTAIIRDSVDVEETRRQQAQSKGLGVCPHDLCHGSSSLVCSAEHHSPRVTDWIKNNSPNKTHKSQNTRWLSFLTSLVLRQLHGKLKHFQPHKGSCLNCMTLPIIQQCMCKSDQQSVIENILKQSILFGKQTTDIYRISQRSSARSVHAASSPASLLAGCSR